MLQPLDDSLHGAALGKLHQQSSEIHADDQQFAAMHAGSDAWFGSLTMYLAAAG